MCQDCYKILCSIDCVCLVVSITMLAEFFVSICPSFAELKDCKLVRLGLAENTNIRRLDIHSSLSIYF
nr:hypothetical protein CJLB15_00007 [Campylobacter phage CJLB-15]